MSDMAVLDAPETETIDSALDDAFASADTPADPAPPETPEPKEQQSAPDVEGDERKLPGWIKELKAAGRMKEFREAKADWYGYRGVQEKLKDFDLDGTKAWLAEQGGKDSIVQTLQEREEKAQELDAISHAIETGDTNILQRIPDESVSKFTLSLMQRMGQVDGEGYNRTLSGIFSQTIAQAQVKSLYQDGGDVAIPVLFAEARSALEFASPEQAKVIASGLLTRMQGYLEGFGRAAAAPVAPKSNAVPLDAREQALNERENQQFKDGYDADIRAFRNGEITKGVEAYLGRKLTPEDSDKLQLATIGIVQQVKDRFKGDKDYRGKLYSHESKRDKDGAMKLLKSREGTALSDIIPKVARTIFGQPKPTPAPKVEAPTVPRRVPTPPARRKDAFDAIYDSA